MAKTKDANGQETGKVLGTRVVYLDEVSPADKNRSISTSVHPALYDALKEHAALVHGKDNVNGRDVLSDGTMALSIREALAAWSEYRYQTEAELVIKTTRASSKTEAARTVVSTLFTALRSKMDYDTSLPVARGVLATMGVTLTETEFADLWDAAA